MSDPLVLVSERDSGVFELCLNDAPTRNAMSEQMAAEFEAAVCALSKNSAVRVVVLRGAGNAFSGGGHLDMLFEKTKIGAEKNRELMLTFYRQFLSLRELPMPVIAAINGHAVGAGLCLALACDIRICHEQAKLGLNFVHLGLHPGMAATYFLPQLVGPARAAELLFTGKIIAATEAAKIGLINEVCAESEFENRVAAVAGAIRKAGPKAMRALKASLREMEGRSLSHALEREASCQAESYASSEFLEGITAAKEKREPKF